MDPASLAHSRRIQIARETLVDLVKSFGFYPADSVIIGWMKAAELVLAQRVDVEVFLEPTDLSRSDLELFIEPGRIYHAEQAMVLTCLTYMDERIYSGIDAVEEVLAKYEIELGEVLVFAGDLVFSRECGEGCEPHLMHVEKQISRVFREAGARVIRPCSLTRRRFRLYLVWKIYRFGGPPRAPSFSTCWATGSPIRLRLTLPAWSWR